MLNSHALGRLYSQNPAGRDAQVVLATEVNRAIWIVDPSTPGHNMALWSVRIFLGIGRLAYSLHDHPKAPAWATCS